VFGRCALRCRIGRSLDQGGARRGRRHARPLAWGAPAGGRAHLLSSVSFTRQQAPLLGGNGDAIVLAGWSRGGKAAAGIAVSPAAASDWRPAPVVCLASGFSEPAPTTGTSPAADLAQGHVSPVPIWLVHGICDPVVSITESRQFAVLLAEHGWPVELEELPTDHDLYDGQRMRPEKLAAWQALRERYGNRDESRVDRGTLVAPAA